MNNSIQNINHTEALSKNEKMGQLFNKFYSHWNYNPVPLKNIVELMFDICIIEEDDEDVITDTVWFTKAFMSTLREFKESLSLQEQGKLLKKHILETLKGGNPYIVEDMFYRFVINSDQIVLKTKVLKFFRTFDEMINGVKVLNGKLAI